MIRVLSGSLAVAVVALVIGLAGPGGLVFLLAWAVAALPGLPVGFHLFGRRHAASWLSGILFGQVITAFAIWLAIQVHAVSLLAMASVWLGVTTAVVLATPNRARPVVTLADWRSTDSAALFVMLWLAVLLMAPAFLGVGRIAEDGSRLYRAYFTADFLWHTALTAELARLQLPLTNPYMASEALHYYWAYFLLPASAVAHSGATPFTAERILLVHATCAGLTFFGMVFVGVWAAVPRAWAALTASLLAVAASSFEGSYALWDLFSRHRPLSAVRSMNIDAVTAWMFRGLRIDGLPRSLWYVPHHAAAVGLGLVALIIVGSAEAGTSMAAIWLAGCALAGATALSPLLGGAFSLAYGLAAVFAHLSSPSTLPRAVARHACAAIPVLLALAWVAFNHVLEGTAGAVALGVFGLARFHPVLTLTVALGPLLIVALLGLAWGRWDRRMLPGVAGLVVGLAVLYLVCFPRDLAYAGFRAGQVLLVTLPMLAARVFAQAGKGGWLRAGVILGAVPVFAAGLPTTVIDAFNAQDTQNRAMGPGFHWTIAVTPAQQAGLDWLYANTAPDAIVQADPVVRGRETWSFIPSFAHRRMAAGLPISLLHQPSYDTRSALVHELYMTESGERACQIAREMGIEYLYLDETERRAIPAPALEKFRVPPPCFRPAFHQADVDVFAIVPAVVRRP